MRAEHITPPRDSEIFHKVPQTFDELLRADRRTAEVLLSAISVSEVLQQQGIEHCFIGGVGALGASGRRNPYRRIKDADVLVKDEDYFDTRHFLEKIPGTFLPIPGAEYIVQPPVKDLGYDAIEGVRLKIFHYNAARKLFATDKHGFAIHTEIDPDWNKVGNVYDFLDIPHPGLEFMRTIKLHQLRSRQVTAAQLYDARLLGLMHLM
jgi:hypothetical protein